MKGQQAMYKFTQARDEEYIGFLGKISCSVFQIGRSLNIYIYLYLHDLQLRHCWSFLQEKLSGAMWWGSRGPDGFLCPPHSAPRHRRGAEWGGHRKPSGPRLPHHMAIVTWEGILLFKANILLLSLLLWRVTVTAAEYSVLACYFHLQSKLLMWRHHELIIVIT